MKTFLFKKQSKRSLCLSFALLLQVDIFYERIATDVPYPSEYNIV